VERLEEMIVRLSLLVFKIDMMQEEQKWDWGKTKG
jgi:hypothetical protein